MNMEDNKLIAEFMDVQVRTFKNGKTSYNPDKDWNLLLLVVGKITELNEVNNISVDMEIKFGYDEGICTLRTRDNAAINAHYELHICEKNKGIETVYKTVVTFVKWYNRYGKN